MTATVLAGSVIMAPVPAHATVACPYGVWTYHQSKTGGCGYGSWSRGVDRLGQPWFKLTGWVGDDRADGSCARVEVHTRVAFVRDSTRTFRACGNGTREPINFFDTDTSSGFTGSVQAWSVRLCVGSSCTAYTDFKPS